MAWMVGIKLQSNDILLLIVLLEVEGTPWNNQWVEISEKEVFLPPLPLLPQHPQHALAVWNSLSQDVVEAKGINGFKEGLEKFMEEKPTGSY